MIETSFLSIFREYDIRGVIEKDLTPQLAYDVGRSFGSMLQETPALSQKPLLIGYDGRLSSPWLEQALAEGASESGQNVLCIGLGPTPLLYYAVHKLDAAGGIMVTGSHNPPNYNGFKFMRGKKALYGEEIKKIGQRILDGFFTEGKGNIGYQSVFGDYIEELVKGYRPHFGQKLKIAWDPGNGATGEVIEALTHLIPGDHFLINEKIDGSFPSHHPDPSVIENLAQLKDIVLKNKCDLGIAFDGDGDRLGVIDNKGNALLGDQILLLLSRHLLKDNPGATIIADVKASQALFDDIQKHGGSPLMWKTGHSLIKAKMAETKALLGGEMSGHIFYADRYYGFDDGIYAAIRFIEMLNDADQHLSELCKTIPKTIHTPEIRFDCPDNQKFLIVEQIKKNLAAQNMAFNDIDGLRVATKEGWFLLRASNTQPALVARIEAETEQALEFLKSMLQEELKNHGLSLP